MVLLREIFSTILVIAGSVSGCIALFGFYRHFRLLRLCLMILPLIIAVFVWCGLVSVWPLFQLLPSVIVLLLVPGFILSELAFKKTYCKTNVFDRLPLFFAISIGFWAITAIFAYRFQLSTDGIIIGVMIFDVVGLLSLVCRSKMSNIYNGNFENHNKYRLFCELLFGFIVISFAIIVGIKAQYHGLFFDTYYHLASFNKIANGDMVISSNVFLGGRVPSFLSYASNQWYLVVGLMSRMAGVNAVWMYVFLSFIMTMITFFTIYLLFRTIVSDVSLAILGSIFIVGTLIYSLSFEWEPLHSMYLEFLPYPGSVSQLILFPLLLRYIFEYIYHHENRNELWFIVVILAFATMGQHTLYALWIPLNIGMVLIASMFLIGSLSEKAKIVSLACEIALISVLLLYLTISFPSSGSINTLKLSDVIALWGGPGSVWFISDSLFASSLKYFFTKGWQDILGLVIIVAYLLFRRKYNYFNAPDKYCICKGTDAVNLVVALIVAVIGPMMIIFNPLIVPALLKIVILPHFFYRMLGSTIILSHTLTYGALVCIILVPLSYLIKNKTLLSNAVPVFIVLLMTFSPLINHRVRTTFMETAFNYDSYPSILKLIDQHPYNSLSKLKPGIVSVDINRAEAVAALTPHHVVTVKETRNIDYQNIESRIVDNEKILSFNESPDEMRHLLMKYNCKYVVVPRNSKNLHKFKENKILFEGITDAGEDVIFSSKI